MTSQKLIDHITQIAKANDGITSIVAQDVLDSVDNYGNYTGYLEDVMKGGCASGIVSSLIYYTDTHEFYNNHAEECESLMNEIVHATGVPFDFKGQDVRNALAWLGYEVRAQQLLDLLS